MPVRVFDRRDGQECPTSIRILSNTTNRFIATDVRDFGDALSQRRHQLSDAIRQADEQSVACAACAGRLAACAISRLTQRGTDQAAVLPFHFDEAWQRRFQAELVRIGGVDAADERLHESLEGFMSTAAADEVGETFVGSVVACSDEELGQQTQLAAPAQQR